MQVTTTVFSEMIQAKNLVIKLFLSMSSYSPTGLYNIGESSLCLQIHLQDYTTLVNLVYVFRFTYKTIHHW